MVVGEGPAVPVDDDEETAENAAKEKGRPGGVAGRDKRHQQRQDRARLRKDRTDTDLRGGRVLLPVEDDRPQRLKDRIKRSQQNQRLPTAPRRRPKRSG